MSVLIPEKLGLIEWKDYSLEHHDINNPMYLLLTYLRFMPDGCDVIGGVDGGVAIWLYSEFSLENEQPIFLFYCKCYTVFFFVAFSANGK